MGRTRKWSIVTAALAIVATIVIGGGRTVHASPSFTVHGDCNGFFVDLEGYTTDARLTVWLDSVQYGPGEFVDHQYPDDPFNNSYTHAIYGNFQSWRVLVTGSAGGFDTGFVPICTGTPPFYVYTPPTTSTVEVGPPPVPTTAAPTTTTPPTITAATVPTTTAAPATTAAPTTVKATTTTVRVTTTTARPATTTTVKPRVVTVGVPTSGHGSVALTATSTPGTVQVKWYVDNIEVASDASSPWSVSWNVTRVARGKHNVYAKARDAAGWFQSTSKVITIF